MLQYSLIHRGLLSSIILLLQDTLWKQCSVLTKCKLSITFVCYAFSISSPSILCTPLLANSFIITLIHAVVETVLSVVVIVVVAGVCANETVYTYILFLGAKC